MLRVFGLVLAFCGCSCSLAIQGSAVPSVGEETPGGVNSIIDPPSTPLHELNGPGLQPPLISPPPETQKTKDLPSLPWPSPLTTPPNHFIPSPAPNEDISPSVSQVPPSRNSWRDTAPIASPSGGSRASEQPHPAAPEYIPPSPHPQKAPANKALPLYATTPAPMVHVPRGILESPRPSNSIVYWDPPSLLPDKSTHPTLPRTSPPPKTIQSEPPSVLPVVDSNASPILAPTLNTNNKTAAMPVARSTKQRIHHYVPESVPTSEGPTASKPLWHFNGAPAPNLFSKSTPGLQSSTRHHHAKISGSPLAAPPVSSLYPSSNEHYSPIPAIPVAPSGQAKTPQNTKMPPTPHFRVLPPPPAQKDCAPLMCMEPLTYGPPEWPCVCVLPIQVGLRLTVPLYTFFPLVSELASEIAAGVFMKQSQVRIMGANVAEDNPEETIILIDLLPLEERFDDATTYLTFKIFWSKQVVIQPKFFGLPSSPSLPPSASSAIIPSEPYPSLDNNGTISKPLGVDIRNNQHNHSPSGGIISVIILSGLVALLLICTLLWVLISRHRPGVSRPDLNQPTVIHSLEKASGLPVPVSGSRASSPSFFLSSSINPYIGSAKTFSSSDIEKATDFFNERRILGEGGFGRVYSGVLKDGTKVAIKILKRYDEQGGQEFFAEVEMLSRLHHRNLVKLIGICIEERTRSLVYELVTNGSVESHLHGFDKERSPLDWSARLKIALGAARALAYLHEDSSPRVIHRDFKASNILLEDDYTPQVSDFGLARVAFDEANRHISTRVMGTFGYVAPEYAMTGHLLVKSDVYSFGVVLLELLTGRRPVDMSQPPGQENLVSWARPLLTTRQHLDSIIDPSLRPDFPVDSIAKVAAIASMCVQPEVSNRPFMGEVVQALKLVCNESDETKDVSSRSCISQEELSFVTDDRDSTVSDRLAASLLTPCSAPPYYDYRIDVEKDLSMSSELLSCAAKFGGHDCESFKRHSSSGPLMPGKEKTLWGTLRRMSSGSVSEHGLFKFWGGSH